MGGISGHGNHLLIRKVMVQRSHDDPLAHAYPDLGQQGCQAWLHWEGQVNQQQHCPAPRQIVCQDGTFWRCIPGAWVGLDERGTRLVVASVTFCVANPRLSRARRSRPRPCCSIRTTPTPSAPWLCVCAPSKCVWYSMLSMSYSPWPTTKQMVFTVARVTRRSPKAMSRSSVETTCRRRPLLSSTATL